MRNFTGGPAYTEGWALYAENGWYDGDIPGRLGQLHGELFRASPRSERFRRSRRESNFLAVVSSCSALLNIYNERRL